MICPHCHTEQAAYAEGRATMTTEVTIRIEIDPRDLKADNIKQTSEGISYLISPRFDKLLETYLHNADYYAFMLDEQAEFYCDGCHGALDAGFVLSEEIESVTVLPRPDTGSLISGMAEAERKAWKEQS